MCACFDARQISLIILFQPPLSQEITIEELADDDWWVATVERTLSLPQEGQHDLGVLEIRWMYSKGKT